jgi:hypothetical protein
MKDPHQIRYKVRNAILLSSTTSISYAYLLDDELEDQHL